jgi:hypothetical protein
VIAKPTSPTESPKSLRPPQFGLRTLLAAVTACAALMAIVRLQWFSPIGVGMLAFLAVSIFLHVAGNVLGTRLRELGDRPDANLDKPTIIRRRLGPQDFAPATRLSQRQSLGWSIIIASSIGVTSGAIGGGLWTFLAGGGHVGAFNIAVGVIAFAVLGGIAAFATVGFVQVLSGAIWQALTGSPALPHAPHLSDHESN